MPTGHYRFRRSLGNVSSNFRGARPDTYPRFTGLLDTYGGAAAAYSLRALSSGWIAGDVVEVRRSSDSTTQGFTASQITNGLMLDFVNGGTSDLYNSARYFNGTNAKVSMSAIPEISVSSDFSVDFTFITDANSGSSTERFVFSTYKSVNDRVSLGVESGQLIVNFWNGAPIYKYALSVSPLTSYSGYLSYDGAGGVTLVANGVTATPTSASLAIAGSPGFFVGGRQDNGRPFDGVIYGINVYSDEARTSLVAAYTGLGTSVTAWEDTIGSNDGIEVNGAAYTGQPFDGFVSEEYDQSGATVRDATQATTTEQIKIVDAGAVVLDGNSNVSTLWDGVDDDLDVLAGFAGLTAANVYAITDNAGVVTRNTLTAQDISLATNWTTILTSLTYQKVTALIIYPDATDQAGIEASLDGTFGT